MRRREFLFAFGTAAALPRVSSAQGSANVPRVIFLSIGAPGDFRVLSFQRGLRELGYVEGDNLSVEYLYVPTTELRHRIAAIVARSPDAFFATATPPALALLQATSSIPVVAGAVTDPVGTGMAASLASPGRNVTGTTQMGGDLPAKSLDLLKTVVSGLNRVAVLTNPTNSGSMFQAQQAKLAGPALGLEVSLFESRAGDDLGVLFEAMTAQSMQAVSIVSDIELRATSEQIASVALKHKLASVFASRADVAAGGLFGYGPDLNDVYRRAVYLLDKVLKGVKPAELPFEQPAKFELAVNLKTAAALGIEVPLPILALADEVIE